MRRSPETDDARFVTCLGCDGQGGREVGVYSRPDEPEATRWEECAECGGSGWVEDCDSTCDNQGLDDPDDWP